MKTPNEYFTQLKEDCQLLQKRNASQQSQKNHRSNELHIYCRLVDYYEHYFPKEEAVWYAKQQMNNIVRPTLEKKLKEK